MESVEIHAIVEQTLNALFKIIVLFVNVTKAMKEIPTLPVMRVCNIYLEMRRIEILMGRFTKICLFTTVGCRADSECDSNKACYQGECVNPCLLDQTCGSNADCTVRNFSLALRSKNSYRYGFYNFIICFQPGYQSSSPMRVSTWIQR